MPQALEALQFELKLASVTKLLLEVYASNAIARHLYEKTGFSVLSIRKDYYQRDFNDQFIAEDALVMCALSTWKNTRVKAFRAS